MTETLFSSPPPRQNIGHAHTREPTNPQPTREIRQPASPFTSIVYCIIRYQNYTLSYGYRHDGPPASHTRTEQFQILSPPPPPPAGLSAPAERTLTHPSIHPSALTRVGRLGTAQPLVRRPRRHGNGGEHVVPLRSRAAVIMTRHYQLVQVQRRCRRKSIYLADVLRAAAAATPPASGGLPALARLTEAVGVVLRPRRRGQTDSTPRRIGRGRARG